MSELSLEQIQELIERLVIEAGKRFAGGKDGDEQNGK
jgi:hypothetical protein